MVLEDGDRTLPADVKIESKLGKGAWVRVIMREGRKRQIREVGKRIGLPVVRILRVRIGTLRLGTLKPREWRNLTTEEVNTLRSLQANSESKISPAARRLAEKNSDRFAERSNHPSSSSTKEPSRARKRIVFEPDVRSVPVQDLQPDVQPNLELKQMLQRNPGKKVHPAQADRRKTTPADRIGIGSQ